MRLKDTVSKFATETFYDVFDSSETFLGKVNPFSEVANSGASSQRRILETTIDVVIPTERVIQSPSTEKFIVAAANHDYWHGEVIRHKYPILPVDVMGSVGTVGEVLAATQPDNAVYSYPYFVRRETDEEERSDYLSGYELYFSKNKSFVRSQILLLGSEYYRLKTDTWVDGAGFAVAQSVRVENPIQVFTINHDKTEYDPALDGYPETTVPNITCFVESLKQDYEFVTPSFTKIQEGDKSISILKSDVTIGVNDRIGPLRVMSVRDNGDWNTCQCRVLS